MIEDSMNERPSLRIITPIIALTLIVLMYSSVPALAEDSQAMKGDTVSVYYNLSLPGEAVFETNINGTPLSFVLGAGAVIKGFDAAIEGMVPGESKTVTLSPDEAYGERNESLISVIPLLQAADMLNAFNKSNVSISLVPGYPGPIIEYLPQSGKRERYVFTNITNETVTVDNNKPLAGSSLQFDVTLVDIKKSYA